VNIDEISCVAKSKGRGRAHELLDILASIAWPRFLKEPPHYLDEIGYYVLRTNLRRPSIFYESGSHHSVLEFVQELKQRPDTAFYAAVDRAVESIRKGNRVFQQIRRGFAEAAEGARLPDGTSFQSWKAELSFDPAAGFYGASKPLTRRCDRKRLWRLHDRSFDALVDALLYIAWSKRLKRGPTTDVGRNDLQQILYAPHVHAFVTDDNGLFSARHHTAARRRLPMRYDAFRRWLNAIAQEPGGSRVA